MPLFAHRRAEEFFASYAAALTSGNLDLIAGSYEYPCLIVAPEATRLIASYDEVVAAFATMSPHAEGQTVAAELRSLETPGQRLAWVTVRWSYRDSSGSEISADAYRYLLRDSDGRVRICTLTPVPREWSH